MRLKDLAGIILATSALLGSAASLVTAVKARAEVQAAEARQDDNAVHTAIQEGNEDLALREEVAKLKDKIASLEAGGRR